MKHLYSNCEKATSYETTQETLALLKILALGNREIEAGKVKPIAEIARRFRVRKITTKHK